MGFWGHDEGGAHRAWKELDLENERQRTLDPVQGLLWLRQRMLKEIKFAK